MLIAATHSGSPFVSLYDADTLVQQPALATPPVGTGRDVAFNFDDSLMAVGHDSSPFVSIYETTGWTKLANPAVLPTGSVLGVAFSPDGSMLAVAHATTPFVTIYNTTTWAKLTNPVTLPTGTGRGVAFSPDGLWLAVGHSTTPFLTLYDTATFTKQANPASLSTPPETVTFSPDSSRLVTAGGTAPFLNVFSIAPLVKLSVPSVAPLGSVDQVNYNPAGTQLLAATAAGEHVTIYETTGWTKLSAVTPATAVSGFGGAFSPVGDTFTIGGQTSPFLFKYDAGTRALLGVPSVPPAGLVTAVAYNNSFIVPPFWTSFVRTTEVL